MTVNNEVLNETERVLAETWGINMHLYTEEDFKELIELLQICVNLGGVK